MDREERLQALNEIEGQLSQYLAADKKNWIQTYLLMSEVQDKELYVVNYRSYTKWVNHLADSLSIHVSTLWARLKARKNYAEYASRARDQGRTVPKIEEIDVSPDSLNLCAKVAGKNAVEMDKLVDQVVAGDLTRENLRQAAKARKAAGEFVAKSRFDCVQAKDRTEMEEKCVLFNNFICIKIYYINIIHIYHYTHIIFIMHKICIINIIYFIYANNFTYNIYL